MRAINTCIGVVLAGLLALLFVAISAETISYGFRTSTVQLSRAVEGFNGFLYISFVTVIPCAMELINAGQLKSKGWLWIPVTAVVSTVMTLWWLLSVDSGFYSHILLYPQAAMRIYAFYAPAVILGLSVAWISSFWLKDTEKPQQPKAA